jgi:hypothetical protein
MSGRPWPPNPGGGLHLATCLVELAALFIARAVGREDHLGAELASLLEHGVDRVRINVGMRRNGLVLVDRVQQLMSDELHVAQRWGVSRHGDLLVLNRMMNSR